MPRTLRPLCDRIGHERVRAVIERLYEELLADERLAPDFASIPDLTGHQAHIVEFWWIAMGGRVAHPRTVDMQGAHRHVTLTRAKMDRWLACLERAATAHLEPELAEAWLTMARGIGERLLASSR